MIILGIVGSGAMGTEVCLLAAESGYTVYIYDMNRDAVKRSLQTNKESLSRYVERGQYSKDESAEIFKRIIPGDSLNDLSRADFILECVNEDIKTKQSVFMALDQVCKGGAVLASNTMSISITSIASVTERQESVIGVQFLKPARAMKIVEIIPGLSTTMETIELAKEIIKKMGKDFVISRDYPGFLLNRVLCLMINEAICLLHEGAASVENIDKTMKKGLNLPMGPLELADMIGLDNILAVVEEMYRGYSDSKYRPNPLLKQYVSAGLLGKKTGRGFYHY
jgi:3-hydroxybutyryl-CoA dehydrogenase